MDSETELRRLLSSHSSIYNTLNNPELDGSSEGPPRIPTPKISWRSPLLAPNTPDLTEWSWQNIPNDWHVRNCSPVPHITAATRDTTPSNSILSITTDEEGDPLKEALFTDEEIDSSFVMPIISMSEQRSDKNVFQISIITTHSSYNRETQQLIQRIGSLKDIKINYLNVNEGKQKDDGAKKKKKRNVLSQKKSMDSDWSDFSDIADRPPQEHIIKSSDRPPQEHIIKSSDLVFIVNDGSNTLVDYLTKVFPTECTPKLTIINMMTVNYFVNLFDLINNLKPYQIWKTSSLQNMKLASKLKDFIEVEATLSEGQLTKKNQNLALVESSRSMYCTSKSTDYKIIEKQLKSDLSASSFYEDPLQISTRFHGLKTIYVISKRTFLLAFERSLAVCGVAAQSPNFWLVCSFSVGIGLGVLVSISAKASLDVLRADKVVEVPKPPERDVVDCIVDFIQDIASMPFFMGLGDAVRRGMESLIYTNSLALTGLERIIGLILWM